MDSVTIWKNKLKAIWLYPQKSLDILRSERVHMGGLGLVCIYRHKIVKYRIKKRLLKVMEEEKKRGVLRIVSLEEEKTKFEAFNGLFAEVRHQTLILPRIGGGVLSYYCQDKQRFLSFLDKTFAALTALYRQKGLYHGDLHIDNVLVGSDEQIYFIDFEFAYVSEFEGHELEADILKLLFHMKVYYTQTFEAYRSEIVAMILTYISRKKLKEAMKKMKPYIRDSLDELYSIA